ncbi:MAG TPA: hypothetical protein ENI73_08830 [Spirochaetes bacterium]|mgnify:CR=1 FL=1|nr:hypothetical protein [Spirochaetota bacterium]
MKIGFSSLLTEAQKIAQISQEYYKAQGQKPKRDVQKPDILKKIDSLKQGLFSIQTKISELQSYKEGLKEMISETENLKANSNPKSLEQYYQNIYHITVKYNYNKNNLITQEMQEILYKKNVHEQDIPGIVKRFKVSVDEINKLIAAEEVRLRKLEVSSENIMAVSTRDRDFFEEVKRSLDHPDIEMIRNVHSLKVHESIDHLLE